MFITNKPYEKLIGTFLTRINDFMVFTKAQLIETLKDLHNCKITSFEIEFANECSPTEKQLRKAKVELDPHSTVPDDEEHVPTISVVNVHAIVVIIHPKQDLSEQHLSTEEIAIVINAISFDAITPKEHALETPIGGTGMFTGLPFLNF